MNDKLKSLGPGDFTLRIVVLMPSRLRNKIVLRISSNWITAAPKTSGEVRRTRAWFKTKVNRREKSWRAMRAVTDAMLDLRRTS